MGYGGLPRAGGGTPIAVYALVVGAIVLGTVTIAVFW
jgi:hypothetical protein